MTTRADSNELHLCYGVMGGFMQPQGHVQVLLNILHHNMDPQSALDAPRICIGAADGTASMSSTVYIEEGIRPEVVGRLQEMGHDVKILDGVQRSMFGRGQVKPPIENSDDDDGREQANGAAVAGTSSRRLVPSNPAFDKGIVQSTVPVHGKDREPWGIRGTPEKRKLRGKGKFLGNREE
ncbi:hypothetical protein HK102_010927 [Quaeritorhiza haematococci]|nr:hypothetical protein HK102_010927 [Quaeritorhiza haematococci]